MVRTCPLNRSSSGGQGDLRLSGPPSGKGIGGEARTYNRRVPADLKVGSVSTVPSTPQISPNVKYSQKQHPVSFALAKTRGRNTVISAKILGF
ncbi:hypothetical protein PoB_005637900 [Plakobranchus ocellatus]|uniref:Uncharacterized protein n=1 Tax=Plakobranchus ocellatus TaxID=259542 RepID=A0AAV4CFD8_9GAST|nr:hypothetical protein PoB_005637900 [Plakobranchus ocellatus]